MRALALAKLQIFDPQNGIGGLPNELATRLRLKIEHLPTTTRDRTAEGSVAKRRIEQSLGR